MPLSGALQADFGDFVNEASKAGVALAYMEAEAEKTGKTMAKTGAVVDGFKAPASLSQLSTGLRSVDATANAMGVSMAKPIAAIEELGKVSGQTFAQLGLLGTAGVAVGVAITGIELGKWISDMTGGLETAKVWQDRLYGSADAADALANRQAILDRTLQATGQTFTDVNLAQEAYLKWVKAHQREIKTAADRQAYWEGQLRLFGGALPKMEEALKNHTTTVKELHREYGINADALTYYLAKKKDEEAITAKATATAEAAAAAQQKLKDSMFGGDSITKANEMAAALGGVGQVSRMTTDEQAKLNTAVGEAIETYKRWGQTAPAALNDIYLATLQLPKVVSGLGSEWASVGTKVTMTADHIVADVKRMKDETASYEAETLRQMEASWQKVPPPVAETTKEVQRLTVAMQDFGRVNQSAWESMQAGAELMKGYQNAGIFVGMQGGAMTGYQAQQRARMTSEVPTGGNTLNVNVNSTEAGDISKKLVDEMRRNGVRF